MSKYNSISIKKYAFTLAEVLITLGIIGVVAALTLPALISNHNKRVVETRLEKFYSIMNQAVRLSEVDYGEFQYWDNSILNNTTGMENWWNTYFAPHVKTLKTEKGNAKLWVYLADGTKMNIFAYMGSSSGNADATSSAIHLYFYPKSNNITDINGKDYFTFFINNNTAKEQKTNVVEPYKFNWDGSEDTLINGTYGCRESKENTGRHYCTALIQYHGWKIPDNYPFRF